MPLSIASGVPKDKFAPLTLSLRNDLVCFDFEHDFQTFKFRFKLIIIRMISNEIIFPKKNAS